MMHDDDLNNSINWCVMILSIGDIFYKKYSKPILTDYFEIQKVKYFFIENIPDMFDKNFKNVHPSWYKLLCHKILPGYDFILCWDLDLLPTNRQVTFIENIDKNNFCATWDTSLKFFPKSKFTENFKYNGGLIGVPKKLADFTETVFLEYSFDPYNWPSWEQYYLNEELASKKITVCELPDDLNYLYSYRLFNIAKIKHYTSSKDAKNHIFDHYKKYFSSINNETKNIIKFM